ncbi:MAG: Deoxycytidylate deaminase [Candidatus Woesebacteria bacterium GW2011_GWB1_45_5]|uniref:Deoxycytidylate deaminase n=1 Tax=Candidatus Woesebacteria bacterium GW2011_GWB1_45_5 TaxID=1618581 RepID=A0A0G1PWD1_9BACT|nr:MAG: Deoxycytidylate deaminase [Candidatus Woesebacteria bacterium GW2011_GWB1_45_5]
MLERTREYITEAYKFAAVNSTDRSTQNGAILVDGSGIPVAWGANHFPRGVAETPERLERPTKYIYVVHAEHEAVLDAAKHGVKTEGLSMYGNWVACNECAKSIIDSGIVKVVGHKKPYDLSPDHWKEPIKIAIGMFEEAGVLYELWEGDIGGVEVLFNGQPFRP